MNEVGKGRISYRRCKKKFATEVTIELVFNEVDNGKYHRASFKWR